MNNLDAKIVVINGGSGSGKTAVAEYLLNHQEIATPHHIVKAVTDNTRAMRIDEIDGVSYWFRTEEEFFNRLNNDEFVEHTFYNGSYRGLRKAELDRCLAIPNALIFLVMDINGLNVIKNLYPEQTIGVYVSVPRELREKRMIERGDSIEAVKSRLDYFEKEEKDNAQYNDYVVSNETTIEDLAKKIIELI